MGLTAQPNNILITDSLGSLKLDLASRRPVVQSRVSGQFSGTIKCGVDHWSSGRDNQDSIAVSGYLGPSDAVYITHQVPGFGSAYFEAPDFYLAKVKISTNLTTKTVSLMGSCLAELGMFGVGFGDFNGLAGHELHFPTVFGCAANALLQGEIKNGSLEMTMQLAPNFMTVQDINDPRFAAYQPWLSFDFVTSGNVNRYKYMFNLHVEYDVTLLKIMGQ